MTINFQNVVPVIKKEIERVRNAKFTNNKGVSLIVIYNVEDSKYTVYLGSDYFSINTLGIMAQTIIYPNDENNSGKDDTVFILTDIYKQLKKGKYLYDQKIYPYLNEHIYKELIFSTYFLERISISKASELLEITIEEFRKLWREWYAENKEDLIK